MASRTGVRLPSPPVFARRLGGKRSCAPFFDQRDPLASWRLPAEAVSPCAAAQKNRQKAAGLIMLGHDIPITLPPKSARRFVRNLDRPPRCGRDLRTTFRRWLFSDIGTLGAAVGRCSGRGRKNNPANDRGNNGRTAGGSYASTPHQAGARSLGTRRIRRKTRMQNPWPVTPGIQPPAGSAATETDEGYPPLRKRWR